MNTRIQGSLQITLGWPSTADLNPFYTEMEYVNEQINKQKLTYLSVFYIIFFLYP